jgi:hypothetical protein
MSSASGTDGNGAGVVLHDFPYRTCVRCGSPIPPHDLIDDDYLPLHRSSCTVDESWNG